MFEAETIDDLTLEQYNMLIELWNMKAQATISRATRRMTSIVPVEGLEGVDYGDD